MSESPIRGVVVAHADLAAALIEAIRRIAGNKADALTCLSNDGKGPEQLRTELDALAGDDLTVVFVDMQGGSCGMAALACCRDKRTRVVVGGVNLPMLLDFVFNTGLPLEELVDRLIGKGRDAIQSSGA